jgi:hypothetical protein
MTTVITTSFRVPVLILIIKDINEGMNSSESTGAKCSMGE